ncbi:MAG TPA: hypothetical protein VHT52_17635 [Stellaceae bacterium]|jgi:hypothetical protein|nr:hypothetical protein [Stellaceae bacterium]
MSKPILCVDFDGVIHSYTSGWKGASVVPDPPVPGAIAFLREAVKHFRVAIFSTRSNQEGGGYAMRDWLGHHIIEEEPDIIGQDPPWFAAIEWPTEKPAAMVTLDDRAITFTGIWPSMDELLTFTPWNKK